MQDQTIPDQGCALDEIEARILWLLLRPGTPGIYSIDEIAGETGDATGTDLACAGLHAAGLAHRIEGFVFTSHAARRFRALALQGTE
jgi:hypothetical protein